MVRYLSEKITQEKFDRGNVDEQRASVFIYETAAGSLGPRKSVYKFLSLFSHSPTLSHMRKRNCTVLFQKLKNVPDMVSFFPNQASKNWTFITTAKW